MGRVSPACETCRARRTKCSLDKPTCKQCIKKKVECVYRDRTDVLFRDQSEQTIARVRTESMSKEIAEGDIRSAGLNRSAATVLSLTPSISFLFDHSAPTFFFNAFGLTNYRNYIPYLYTRDSCLPALKISVTAVGLTALAVHRRDHKLFRKAQARYSEALKATQSALGCLDMIHRDDLLGCIMLLALYSTLTTCSTETVREWSRHIRGAQALLELDSGHFPTAVSTVIRNFVAGCVLIDCLAQGRKPPKTHRVSYIAPENGQGLGSNFQARSQAVASILVDLRNTEITLENAPHITTALAYAEAELSTLFDILEVWPFQVIAEEDRPGQDPPQHVYINHLIANIWNGIRVQALITAELKYTIMSKLRAFQQPILTPQFSVHVEAARTMARCTIQQICASVPSFLRPGNFASSGGPNQPFEAPSPWTHTLLWPLSKVHASVHISDDLRPFVAEVLQNCWSSTIYPSTKCQKINLLDGDPPHEWTHVFFMG